METTITDLHFQHRPARSTTATGPKSKSVPTTLYPGITPGKPLLRVGVMLDDWTVPAWVAEVLRSVPLSVVAEVTTVILNRQMSPLSNTAAEKLKQLLSAAIPRVSTLLWDRYVQADQRRNPEFVTPFRPTDIRLLLADTKVINVVPIKSGLLHRFSQADTAAIKREALDVIVRFGFGSLGGDILSAAKYGVWSYHHGDNNEYRGDPPGFWEMYEQNPLTGTIFQMHTDQSGNATVIYRTYGATHSFESLLETRYWPYQKAITFVARCLRRLYVHGPAGLSPEPQAPAYTSHAYRIPRNRHMLLFFMRIQWMHLIVRLQNVLNIQRHHWFLAIGRGVMPEQKLAGKISPVQPPRGRLWADPMIVCSSGRTFMFFEDYDYSLRRAHISVAELDSNGRMDVPRIALQADYHLSYPFVFEWGGTHYMTLETKNAHAVQLYRAVDFPTRWEYVHDLLSGINAVDPTVCEHDGHWYLFTTVSESGGSSCDELFLFVAKTPLGPWEPHPMNPIVSDVRCARPGGAPFRRNGALYRPSQNSERTYGGALAIMEVTKLTPTRYAERLAYRIEPNWLTNIYGCHTITMAGDLIALDCKALKWRAKSKALPRRSWAKFVPSSTGELD